MDRQSNFKILVVDDNKTNLDVLTHILKDSYDVYTAKSGEAALKRTAAVTPDLILLDVIMPDMNGYEVLKILRADEQTADIPVIFITGLSNAEDENRGIRLGAADYISKPFNNEIVKARVRSQLKIVELSRTIEEFRITDELTGIPNRRSFDKQLYVEWGRALREQSPVSLAMICVDGFGDFREKYGYDAGDVLLRSTSRIITSKLKRATDITTRYGEEVFAVIMPNTNQEGALKVAKDIRQSVSDIKLEHDETVTFSIGISVAEPQAGDGISPFVLSVDRNLYKAKAIGNEICF